MRVLHHLATLFILVMVSSQGLPLQTGFTTDDTRAAITQASETHGVSEGFLSCIVYRESTYRPWAVGLQGEQGAVQLHPRSVMMTRFYAAGHSSPFDPYQAVDFLAVSILEGLGRHWSGWRACIA
jgi:Transglycosylase SLT domain